MVEAESRLILAEQCDQRFLEITGGDALQWRIGISTSSSPSNLTDDSHI